MHWFGMSARTVGFVAMACMAALLIGPGRADGNFITQVTITNNSGVAASDLEMTFTGTDGMIMNPFVVSNPSDAGAVTITGGSPTITDVTLNWAAPAGLPVGDTVTFDFFTFNSSIAYVYGEWTYIILNPIPTDSVRDNIKYTTFAPTPEPSSLALMSFPVAVGLFAAWRGRRRR